MSDLNAFQIHRVLWVEESVRTDYAHWPAPLFMEGGFDLVVAENATQGIEKLLRGPYDAIIIDIRIPPGEDQRWIQLYKNAGYGKHTARLGIGFLQCILGSDEAPFLLDQRPNWIYPEIIGVLTVESYSGLKTDMDKLKITSYREKTSTTPDTILLELVMEILQK